MQHADFTQISLRFHADYHAECVAESLQNPFGMFPESMRNLSMPYPSWNLCSMQISRKFYADFTQTSMHNALRNFCRIFGEYLRNLCEILAESLRNPCVIYLCLYIHAGFRAACRFNANFTQISRRLPCRMRCGIVAKSLQNLCGIHPESIYALSMFDFMQYADFSQISRRSHAHCYAECVAESLRNPCGIYLCLIHSWFHAACRFHAHFTQISRRLPCRMLCLIFAGSLRNPCGMYLCISMLDSMQHADYMKIAHIKTIITIS